MSIDAECDQLTNVPILRQLDLAKRKLIAMSSELISYKQGAYLFRQGEQPEAIYLLMSGTVRIITDDNEVAIEVARVEAPAVLGETSVLLDREHSASAHLMTDASVLRTDARVFVDLVKQIPELSMALSRELAGRLEATNKRLLSVSGTPTDGIGPAAGTAQ